MGFIAYKTILNFLLPPGFFLLTLIITLIFLFKHKYKYAKILLLLNIIFLYLFSITPIKDAFLLPLENRYEVIPREKILSCDGIIVLGGGVLEKAPISIYKTGQPSQTAIARLNEAVRLYNYRKQNNLITQIFITGGSVYGNEISEAKVYENYLISLGVKYIDVISEERSRTTYENILYIKEYLDIYGVKKPILVTSATHINRGIKTVKNFDIEAVAAPCDFNTSRTDYDISDFYPSARNIDLIKRALWEYIGLIYYDIKFLIKEYINT